METISNLTQTATKYIYGDKPAEQTQAENTHAEPISGETGKGTKTDPYDAGNKDEENEVRAAQISNEEPLSGKTGAGTKTDPFDSGNKAEEKTVSSSDPIPTNNEPENSSAPKENPDVPTIPKEHNVEESHQPVRKPEGTEHPEDGPAAPEPSAPSKVPAENKGDELINKRDPNDHSGEPMKVHDGSEKKTENTDGPNDDDDEETKKKKAEEKGTGDKWVKTSGLAADGGDFDATKPGAGREADRLLEQKGIHKGSSSDNDPAPHATGAGEEGKKTSVTKKIKEKLHIGSSKHS